MSTSCTSQDCSSCGEACANRSSPEIVKETPHHLSKIKKVIAIVSGKGGVGKSSVTSLLATGMQRKGYAVGILDADITGPSIPKCFGATQQANVTEDGIFPVVTKTGIKMISINLLLEAETRPVVWRGPVIAGVVKQFWTDVVWGEVDYLFVDMPPGTGDVPLTVYQSLPIDGIILVTSPQDLVSMVVAKAVEMANLMNIPILGLIENMSYAICPCCDERIELFGETGANKYLTDYQLDLLAQLPLDPKVAAACDKGAIELADDKYFAEVLQRLEKA